MAEEAGSGQKTKLALAALVVALVAIVAGGVWAVRVALRAPAPGGAPSGAAQAADSRSIEETLAAAREYIRHDKAGSAVAILREAVEKWPQDQAVRLLYGEALLSTGQGQAAYDQYDAAIQIGPDNPEFRHVAATIASGIGRLIEAEMHYLAAQRMDPKNPKYALYLAQVQRKQGMNDEARANLMLAANLDPSLAIAWASLAGLALDENRASVALNYIRRARELEPERLDWRVIEARALMRESRPEAAAELLLAVREEERLASPAAVRELAAALAMLGRTSEAASMYVKAVAANPDDAELAYQAALSLERDGQKGRAATFASHAAAKGFQPAQALADRLNEE